MEERQNEALTQWTACAIQHPIYPDGDVGMRGLPGLVEFKSPAATNSGPIRRDASCAGAGDTTAALALPSFDCGRTLGNCVQHT